MVVPDKNNTLENIIKTDIKGLLMIALNFIIK